MTAPWRSVQDAEKANETVAWQDTAGAGDIGFASSFN